MPSVTARLLILSCSVAAAPATGAATSAHASADLVVTDARVYTAAPARTVAQAFAVENGRIVFVGTAQDAVAWIGPKTRVEHAAGRLVLPGLYDSHIHPTEIVDLDVCDLKSAAKSLKAITEFVKGCITRYKIAPGQWVNVEQWNFSNGNEPDPAHPTLRAALDLAAADRPIQLLGNDGHHGAFNSAALARAKNAAGKTVGYSKASLGGDLKTYRKLVGVDASGEPNGTANEESRDAMDLPSMLAVNLAELMKAPARVTARLNSVGITGMLDAAVDPQALPLYDALDKSGKLTVRTTLALYFDPTEIKTKTGAPDWDRMVGEATRIRAHYANNPLLHADIVKLFADGVLEGNPYAIPPTLPEVGAIKPYLQPIFAPGKDGHMVVTGYVDTAAPACVDVRAHADKYASADSVAQFRKAHGYHPGQCDISSGQLQAPRAVLLEFVRRFHLAGFPVHIHAIGDLGIRTAVDAIEAARAADGISSQHDALAHIQLVNPVDAVRIGRDHLYLAFTYAWAYTDPEYDVSVIPFFDRITGTDSAALHPANGYYEKNAYPVKTLLKGGAILLGGSDAPVDTRDPRPFVNMSMAVSRSQTGKPPLNPAESISIRDVVDAYTINGARYLHREAEAGSIEVGKSADFIVLDRDILALGDSGKATDIANTKVLETWFMGKRVFNR